MRNAVNLHKVPKMLPYNYIDQKCFMTEILCCRIICGHLHISTQFYIAFRDSGKAFLGESPLWRVRLHLGWDNVDVLLLESFQGIFRQRLLWRFGLAHFRPQKWIFCQTRKIHRQTTYVLSTKYNSKFWSHKYKVVNSACIFIWSHCNLHIFTSPHLTI